MSQDRAMNGEPKEAKLIEASRLLTDRIKKTQHMYRWKAENIVRFLEHLGMSTEAKVEFVAYELACAKEFGAYHSERIGERDV